MDGIFSWLTSLPPAALYTALAIAAAIENVVPPLPSDTVVAFGAFLAARGEASLLGAFLATWGGNIAGAMMMYMAGRRFGGARLKLAGGDNARRRRITELYEKYGILGLALSRFLPGVRALVPPIAGALKLSPWSVFLAFAGASAIWYGAITVLAYRIGADWPRLSAAVARGGMWTAIAAATLVAVVAAAWWIRRKRA